MSITFFIRATLACALVVARPLDLTAQTSAVQAGDRLRIEASQTRGSDVVTMVRLRGDTLIVSTATDSALAVPFSSIERLQVSRGKSRLAGAGRGALVGFSVGAVLGVTFTTLVSTATGGDDEFGALAGLISLAETGVATALGAGIGAMVGRERWETVALSR